MSDTLKLTHARSSRAEAGVTLSSPQAFIKPCLVCPPLYLGIAEGHLFLHHTILLPSPKKQTPSHALTHIKATVPRQGQAYLSPCCARCVCIVYLHSYIHLCSGCTCTLEKWQGGGWLPHVCATCVSVYMLDKQYFSQIVKM